MEPIVEIVVRGRRAGINPGNNLCPVLDDNVTGKWPRGIKGFEVPGVVVVDGFDGSVVKIDVTLLSS